MKKYLALIYLLFFLVAFPGYTFAGSAEGYFQLGVGVQDFGYKEFSENNVLLDREDGLMPGLVLEIGKSQQDVSGIFHFELFDGLVDYAGQTQSGIPLITKTEERITVFEALLHIKVKALAQNSVAINAGLGHREWRRDIRATNISNSLFEVYSWKYFTAGAELVAWRHGRWSIGLDMRWLRPIKPTMSVDILGFDEVTLDLKSHNSARINIPVKYEANDGMLWVVTPYWESWQMGRSEGRNLSVNGVPTASTVFEPRNETSNFGMTVSVRL